MKIPQEVFDFISQNENADTNALRLKYATRKSLSDFPLEFALIQIEARKKCRRKLPSFVENKAFIFPSLIAAEQASNESVAHFHASLLSPGTSLLDLTAGLGIDDMTFAANGINVISCEIEKPKCDALIHNAEILKVGNNLKVKCTDSIEYLANSDENYDVIFADPARRSTDGKRVHVLEDCLPDIIGNMQLVLNHANRLLVKASPLLDLSLIINTVSNLKHVYVVCFRGECKESLIEIEKGGSFSGISCLDLDWDKTISVFHSNPRIADDNAVIDYAALPSPIAYRYLYEPNAAVMKTGDWTSLAEEYPQLLKADPNTHLFFSNTFYDSFPGRRLEISQLPDKKALKALKGCKYNVVARNHPLTAPQISKKYSIVAGGNDFLYAFRYRGIPTLLLASEKVSKT